LPLPSKKLARARLPARAATAPLRTHTWFIDVLALIACIVLAFFIGKNPAETFTFLLFVAAAILIWHKPKIALYITIFLPIVGELYRLNFGPENGALMSDIFIPLLIGIWLLKKYFHKQKILGPARNGYDPGAVARPLFFFVCAGIISLAQALLFLKPAEVLISSFYLIRFTEYALLFLLTQDLIKTEKEAKRLTAALFASASIIAVAGFIQLIIYPDLGKLEAFGWDPHINRLVSTWLDPNFVGGLLAFVTTIILSLAVAAGGASMRAKDARGRATDAAANAKAANGASTHAKDTAKIFAPKFWLLTLAAFLSTALFLTYSRSAYLALATGILILGLFKSRRLLIICVLIFVAGISLSPRAEERIQDLQSTISSIIFNTAENPDATARLRITNWEQTLSLIARRPLFGSGYNTLRYVKFNEGMVSDPQNHSASGSDSSLLTILATTGLLGFIPFLWLHLKVLALSYRKSKQKTRGWFIPGLSFGLFAGLITLLVHSLFVNSLLFPQILIFVWIIVGIVINVVH
jgi:O-antigen ligase